MYLYVHRPHHLGDYGDNKEEGTSYPYADSSRNCGDNKEGASYLYIDSLLTKGLYCGGQESLVLHWLSVRETLIYIRRDYSFYIRHLLN